MENWRPKIRETYYHIHFTCFNDKPSVLSEVWLDTVLDWAFYNAGVVHETFGEAEAHLEEDFKKLTGKEIKNYYSDFVKIFGIELGEEFLLYELFPDNVKFRKDGKFKITRKGMLHKDRDQDSFHFTNDYLDDMLSKRLFVEKIVK